LQFYAQKVIALAVSRRWWDWCVFYVDNDVGIHMGRGSASWGQGVKNL